MNARTIYTLPLTAILFWSICLTSCARYEIPRDVRGPAFIEVSPLSITADSGNVSTIWVTILDGSRNPLANVPVHASSDTPARVRVSPENLLTDKNGKAIFTAHGVSHFPGEALITFTADGLSAQVETSYILQ